MAKNKETVYVPTAPVSKEQAQAPTKIDTPDYPDKGVGFANYSKTLISGNNFKLNPQIPFDYNVTWTPAGGVTNVTLNLTQSNQNVHYLKKILISHYTINSMIITLSDPLNGRVFLLFRYNNSAFSDRTINFDFDIPLKIETNQIQVTLSAGAVLGDEFNINIYGYSEPN